MPAMGESVTEGTILEWHVAEGQEVAEGDTIVEVSTDKIDAEVPAPASGVITKIMAQPDDTVSVGQVLAQLDTNGTGNGAAPAPSAEEEPDPETASDSEAQTQTEPSSADGDGTSDGMVSGGGEGDADIGESDPEDLLESAQGVSADDSPVPDVEDSSSDGASGETVVVAMPEMGESVTEGTVLEWAVAVGDSVAEGDTVVEVSTDKVDAEVPAPAAGTITKLLVEPDDVVKVGQPLAEMSAGAAPSRHDGRRST